MFTYSLLLLSALSLDHFASQEYADISFGARQVEQVTCDRPELGEVISHNASLRQLLILQFAGAFGEGRVYWDGREPAGVRPADHLTVRQGYPAMVRVSKSSSCSSIDKCAILVFELFNLEVDSEIETLILSTAKNRKSKEAFAIDCTRLEFDAAKRTQAFFLQHPMWGVRSWRDTNYLSIESLRTFAEHLQFLNENKRKGEYDTREHFGKMYDQIVARLRD